MPEEWGTGSHLKAGSGLHHFEPEIFHIIHELLSQAFPIIGLQNAL